MALKKLTIKNPIILKKCQPTNSSVKKGEVEFFLKYYVKKLDEKIQTSRNCVQTFICKKVSYKSKNSTIIKNGDKKFNRYKIVGAKNLKYKEKSNRKKWRRKNSNGKKWWHKIQMLQIHIWDFFFYIGVKISNIIRSS